MSVDINMLYPADGKEKVKQDQPFLIEYTVCMVTMIMNKITSRRVTSP